MLVPLALVIRFAEKTGKQYINTTIVYLFLFSITSFDLSHVPIVEYVEKQFEAYLQEELNIKRNLVDYHDTRVHVCVYFISPTGRMYAFKCYDFYLKIKMHISG